MANVYDVNPSDTSNELIVSQPIALQHEGRLRGPYRPGSGGTAAEKKAMLTGTRKHGTNYSRARQNMPPCEHWAMLAYTVFVQKLNGWCLGIKFQSGYRCYYPNTVSPGEENPWVRAITNAESGSHWVWDNLKDQALGKGYEEF
jgi:hypothetical protein